MTDRSSGETQRLHDERVGGERDRPALWQRDQGRVGEGRSLETSERVEEDGVDQGRRSLASGPVRQRDDVVAKPRPAAAEGLDPLEHGRFPVAQGFAWCGRARSQCPDPPRSTCASSTRERAALSGVSSLLHRRPEAVAERRLRLLDPVHAVRPDDEAVIERLAGCHLAPFVAGEADRQKVTALGFLECPDDVLRVPARRESHRDVARAPRTRSAGAKR